MKRLLHIIIFVFVTGAVSAQCTVNLPSNTIKVTQDSTIATNLGAGQNYLICPNATLTYSGTQSAIVNYYLEAGATVKSARSHQAVVWMKAGAEFDASYSESGNWAITNEAYYESGATFTDYIAGSNLNVCPQVVFNYGNVGSCGGSLSVANSITPESIKLHPNPANENFILNFGATGKKDVEIVSVLGVKVAELSTTKDQAKIDVSNFQSGAYIVLVTDSFGNRLTKKLIVKH